MSWIDDVVSVAMSTDHLNMVERRSRRDTLNESHMTAVVGREGVGEPTDEDTICCRCSWTGGNLYEVGYVD